MANNMTNKKSPIGVKHAALIQTQVEFRFKQEKRKLLLCFLTIFFLIFLAGCHSPFRQLTVDEVEKVIFYQPIGNPGESYSSSEISEVEIIEIVKWYNESYDIRNNRTFKGTVSILGVQIILKDKTDISIIDSGEDFEIQIDYSNNKKTVSFWARQHEIDVLLTKLMNNDYN